MYDVTIHEVARQKVDEYQRDAARFRFARVTRRNRR